MCFARKRTVLAVALCFGVSFSGCTHQIGSMDIDERPSPEFIKDAGITLIVPKESQAYSFQLSSVAEDWNFQVGHSLVILAKKAFSRDYRKVKLASSRPDKINQGGIQRIVEIRVKGFEVKIGDSQYSHHKARVSLEVEVLDGGYNQLWAGTVQGDSDATGIEMAYRSNYLQRLIVGYEQSMSIVMTKSILDGIDQILEKVDEGRHITKVASFSISDTADSRKGAENVVRRALPNSESGMTESIEPQKSFEKKPAKTLPKKIKRGGSGIEIFLGNKDGTFQRRLQIDAKTLDQEVAAGDFNGDGVIDFVVVNR